MKKSTKIIALTIVPLGGILIIALITIGAFRIISNLEPRENIIQEVRQMALPVDRYNFFLIYRTTFEIQLTIEGETIIGFENVREYVTPTLHKFNPYFDDLVFVRSQGDADGFPDNVVVVWLVDEEWWQRFFYAVNWAIKRDEDDVRHMHRLDPFLDRPFGIDGFEQRFGLTYPIDFDDVVNNFDQLSDLLWVLSNEISFAGAFADQHITELPPPAWQRSSQEQEPIPTTGETHPDLITSQLTAPQQQLLDKFNYAYNFYFQFNDIDSVRAKIDPTNPAYDPSYTDIVFLQTAAEVESLPQGTIAAWLPEEQIATQFIHMIHSALSFTEDELDILGEVLRDVITLEQFSLSYPLQPSDLVDNWEKVNALWNALKPIEQYTIRAFALRENHTPAQN